MFGRQISLSRRFRRDARGEAPMPIIVGSPRSGTTLLRFMLDAHPDLAIPPETGFLTLGPKLAGRGDALRQRFFAAVTRHPSDAPAWPDFGLTEEEFDARLREIRPFTAAAGFRLFYRMYAARFGKPRWGDKTPGYCRHLKAIERLLPEVRFIHLVRDGRDAAVSLRRLWFSPGHDIHVQARFWRDNVLMARQQGRSCRHYREVRYEDLLGDTETALRGLCAFVDLEFHEAMLRQYERAAARLEEHQDRMDASGNLLVSREKRLEQQAATTLPLDHSRIGGWRESLTRAEVREFESIAGEALRAFGYASADCQRDGT